MSDKLPPGFLRCVRWLTWSAAAVVFANCLLGLVIAIIKVWGS